MKQRPAEHQRVRTGAGSVASAAPAAVASELAKPGRSDRQAPLPDGGAAGAIPFAQRLHPDAAARPIDLRAPELYLNRELTWLAFNRRVLHEAQDPRTPLLERVKFLAIVNANLDEFFMKRIGGLKQQVGAGVKDLTVDGRTPEQQINECVAFVRAFTRDVRATYLELLGLLRQHDLALCAWADLSPAQQEALRVHYLDNIFPLVTPLAMDPAHPFPFISNLSLNLLVTLYHPDDQYPILARVKVPIGSGVPRFLKVGERNLFVRLEDVMAHNLDALFPGMQVQSCEFFRVTRNANTEQDEDEADDLLAMIEAELRERRFAPIVRLEIEEGMNPVRRGMLAAELGLREDQDVFDIAMPLGLKDLFEIAGIGDPALHDPPHHPVTNAKLEDERNIFHIIRETGPILLQHPYESFGTSVERFVHEASRDPNVLAIKMTLYRTSASTRIIDDLIEASRNGKQVAVVVEIKARFDEAANIQWANRLERTGIHVMYGVVGLKTHSKVILVVRRDFNGLRRYAHIGTGNYHAGTARIYSDLGLLTCDDGIGRDLVELFNYLTTGYKPSRSYQRILAAPRALKRPLLDMIEREIRRHSPGPDPLQDERARRFGHRRGAVPRRPRRGRDRADRARHLPPAPGAARPVRDRHGGEHRRALPGARAHLLLPQWRRRGVLHRLGRSDEAQSGKPGRGGDAGARSGAAGRAPVHPGHPDQRPQERLGNAPGRQLRAAAAAQRSRGGRLPAGPDRCGRTAPFRGQPAAQAQAALDRAAPVRGDRLRRR
jgi:polyphosphate kinase